MILESVIHCQLYEYLDSNYLLLNMQFGLRSKRSTATALSGFTDEVLLNMEKGNICSAEFLDLSEALDTVDHGILMSKLSSVGVSPQSLEWFLRIWVIGISKPFVIINYPKPSPLLPRFHKEASYDPYCSSCINYQRATCDYSTLRGIIVSWRCCSLPLRKRTSRAGEQVERRYLQRSIVAKSE